MARVNGVSHSFTCHPPFEIHKWNESYLSLLPRRRASLLSGQYSRPNHLKIGAESAWVADYTETVSLRTVIQY